MMSGSEHDFVRALRDAVYAYLDAVDRWEAAYRKYFRMPGHRATVSADMVAEQREYEHRRRRLEELLPYARQLCLKHRIRNPLAALTRINLGEYAPQSRTSSAISRNERNAVVDCLVQLADACTEFAPPPPVHEVEPPAPPSPGGTDRRRVLVALGGCTLAGLGIGLWAMLRGRGAPVPVQPAPVLPRRPHRNPAPPPLPEGLTGPIYRIRHRPMADWGDYSDILQDGMTAHLERTNGLLSLERTGPYMPPITFPGVSDVVVSAACRSLLEGSGLRSFQFRPVYKARIVWLEWEKWDLQANNPKWYPTGGEPEDYILTGPPSSEAARQLGDVWEVIGADPAPGNDVFQFGEYGGILVNERAKRWFEEHLGKFVDFEEYKGK